MDHGVPPRDGRLLMLDAYPAEDRSQERVAEPVPCASMSEAALVQRVLKLNDGVSISIPPLADYPGWELLLALLWRESRKRVSRGKEESKRGASTLISGYAGASVAIRPRTQEKSACWTAPVRRSRVLRSWETTFPTVFRMLRPLSSVVSGVHWVRRGVR
jgi:hypothetical protein